MTIIAELNTALRQQHAAGRKPNDGRVTDLEERLAEATARLEEIQRGANAAETARDADLFKGVFLHDADAVRAHFRAVTTDNTRAIDSGDLVKLFRDPF